MPATFDATTDPGLRSFFDVPAEDHFPIQNLPYGVFDADDGRGPRIGTAIGDHVVDLAYLCGVGLIREPEPGLLAATTLNHFMAAGRPAWSNVRAQISRLLSADVPTLRDDAGRRSQALIPQDAVTMHLPAVIGDYTDFYSSREHATNVGTMFRGAENALMPNWLHIPVGYHGRSSSIVISGTGIRRPCGQTKPEDAPPVYGPSRLLDIELELGFFVGPGNNLGRPIPINDAPEHIFGLVLVNDWSARDIQKWEYVPLGPFLGKNFATTISPWVVTLDALKPFRTAGPEQDPAPLPYLAPVPDRGIDLKLEVHLAPGPGARSERVIATNFRNMYWDMYQQLAHHTVNGCNARPGDLMASGTISGSERESCGSLLERTWRGTEPLEFEGGIVRRFLEDGDQVRLTGWAQGDGYRVGFGEAEGQILPARCR